MVEGVAEDITVAAVLITPREVEARATLLARIYPPGRG
jgi:hypothetical protein